MQDRYESKHRYARCKWTAVKSATFMNFAWRVKMVVAAAWNFLRRLFNVKTIIERFAATHTGATNALIAIICGAFAMLPASAAFGAATDDSRPVRSQLQHHALQLAAEPSTAPAPPEETDEDDKDVPTSQVDKYISVYESMQKDHNLTVEQAASKQGLTVDQFRALENKIEADDTLRERVRKALRHAANPNDKSTSDD
jgi:hypothetical protein